MRKVASHLLLFVFTFTFSMLLFAKPAEAGFADWFSNLANSQKVSENTVESGDMEAPNNTKHTFETSSAFGSWMLFQVAGGEAINQVSGLTDQEVEKLRADVGSGAIGDITNGIIATYNPPASSQTYVADLLETAKIIPEAQAQGLGFSALDPVLETWKVFRNIAYLFFVIIFLVIGFMIMFRSKIGQAAITVQQAIPSILIALLAVTFSYAIAGLLIDLMYLLMYMLAGLFSQGTDIINKNVFGLVGMMFSGGTFGDAKEAITTLMDGLLDIGFVGDALSWVSGLTGAIIVGVAILIGTFKVFFELLKSYISLILQVVFSPIILMLDAIPGRNKFVDWFKNIGANLLMWPIVLICLLVNKMLTSAATGTFFQGDLDTSIGGFMPPFLLGQGNAAVFPVLVGVGILLVIPEIMQQAKKAMGVSDGIFGDIAKTGFNRVKKDLRLAATYTPPVFGAASGLATGVYRGIEAMHPDDSISGKFNRLKENTKANVGYNVARGNRISTSVANILELKGLDPNAWENTLVSEARDKKLKEAKEKRDALYKNKKTEDVVV